MKKSLFFIAFIVLVHTAMAQVSKTVDITTAGTLGTTLTATEKSTVTNLTVTGNIDARDFKTMRDDMPLLAVLDLGAVNIMAFTGIATTSSSVAYPANQIPQWAFYNFSRESGKTSLTSIVLPESITSIGVSAFYICRGFTGSLTIPNSVTSIGDHAFEECSGFNGSLTLSNSLTYIGVKAFRFCSGFTGSLTIPNSVSLINQFAFSECSGFNGSLTILNGVDSNSDGSYGSLRNSTFLNCSNFTELNLPNNITEIGDGVFVNCAKLTKIKMPRSFPPTVYDNTFTGIPKNLCTLYVPAGAKGSYQAADFWKDFTLMSEIIGTSTFAPQNSNLKIYASHSEIVIEGVIAGQIVNVFGIDGKKLSSQISNGENVKIPLKTNGVYIVKVGERSSKVIL